MELRLCSIALATNWPLDGVPRDRAKRWYRHRYGLMFGRALFDAFNGLRPVRPEYVLLAYKGVAFANGDQIAWAIHTAGAAACVQGICSDPAQTIADFANSQPP